MTKITISARADVDAKGHPSMQVSGLIAAADMLPMTPVRIVQSTDASGTYGVRPCVAGEVFDGVTAPGKSVVKGQGVTVLGIGWRFHASDAGELTPGLYGLTAVSREVDSASVTKLFRAVSKHDLQIIAVGQTSSNDF